MRLADGTLRLTIVHDRRRGTKWLGGMSAACLLLAVGMVVMWTYTGSVKALVLGAAFLPLASLLCGLLAILQLRGPRHQTHVVEAGPAGLVIQTMLMGSPITHRHARAEVVAVVASDMALEVRTTKRGAYSCMAFLKPKHIKAIADHLNRELGLSDAIK